MKHWWWQSKIFLFFGILGACPHRQPKPVTEPVYEMDSSVVISDTMQSDSILIDSMGHKVLRPRREAPNHNSPDEMKLDSIKKSKEKGKH